MCVLFFCKTLFVALSFPIFVEVSLEDRINIQSFRRETHGGRVKHRGCWTATVVVPAECGSEGICTECRSQTLHSDSGTAYTSSGNETSGAVHTCSLHLSICGQEEGHFSYHFAGRSFLCPSCRTLSLPSDEPCRVSASVLYMESPEQFFSG